ncbi:MAG: hypothetical protein AB7S63_06280 [Thauera sp.]
MLAQARRVLKPGGLVVLGFIDRDSALGRDYVAHREASIFYRDATFHTASDVERLLLNGGFAVRSWAQTLAHPLAETLRIEPARPGRGECVFVVVDATNTKPAR